MNGHDRKTDQTGDERQVRGRARRLMRLRGLLRKEMLQVVRDPSSIAIALVMPVVLLFLFGYGVSLDAKDVPIAVVMEDPTPAATDFAARFLLSDTFVPELTTSMRWAEEAMRRGRVDAILRIGPDFSREMSTGTADIQLTVNGVDANRARQIIGYVNASWQKWVELQVRLGKASPPPVRLVPRMWFNPSSRSQNFLVPGLIVLIMTLSGSLLTALVMAREWERGTMEALLVTPVRVGELLFGKLAPYFVLGMGGMVLAVVMAVTLFGVPLHGSLAMLVLVSSLFMLAALGMGLFISVVARNQFVAAQTAILATFLPAFFLSSFIFDLDNAPVFIRALSHLVAARYFTALIKTVFLAGDVMSVIWPNALALLAMAVFFLTVARIRTRKSLE